MSIASVAVRAILDRPALAAVIVGTRLGVSDHIEENTQVFGLSLNADDLASIDTICAKSRDLMAIIGVCGDEYR